jgi:undecaprenyl-diphosphatase
MFNFLNAIEQDIVLIIQSFLSNQFLDWFFPLYTDLHKDPWFIFSCAMPLFLLWVYFEWKNHFWIIYGFVLTVFVTDTFCGQFIKKSFERVRPFQYSASVVALSPASGFSFVSNHAANSFAIATFLSYFYPKYKWIFWVLAGLTSFSRIYNGVHYPSDVIIGGLLGILFSRLIIKFIIVKKMVKV